MSGCSEIKNKNKIKFKKNGFSGYLNYATQFKSYRIPLTINEGKVISTSNNKQNIENLLKWVFFIIN